MDDNIQQKRKVNPVQNASFLSKITFLFTAPIFIKGEIHEKDIYQTLESYTSTALGTKLEQEWEKENCTKNPSFLRTLLRLFRRKILLLGVLVLVVDSVSMIAKPLLVGKIVKIFDPDQKDISSQSAFIYGGALIACLYITGVMVQFYSFQIAQLTLEIKIACSALLYRKLIKTANIKNSRGLAITLITKDLNSADKLLMVLYQVVLGVVQITVMAYLMYTQVGIFAYIGISWYVLYIPLQVMLGKCAAGFRLRSVAITDERLKTLQEVFTAARTIRMYSWESFHFKNIQNIRKKEMANIANFLCMQALGLSFGFLSLQIILYIIISTYVASGQSLTAEKAFMILTCIRGLLAITTIYIPSAQNQYTNFSAALRRFSEFLKIEEIPSKSHPNYISEEPASITVKNLTVKLENTTVIQNVSFRIENGLTLLQGTIGCGKSALLQTLIGEIQYSHGSVNVSGTISYASQEPWIFPGSIRQNILFGESYNKKRYDNIIEICGLSKDFEVFSNRDSMYLTDRGNNLSKGQKIRINLARCIYKDADIYLLDDCLSSLDTNMTKQIFFQCIKGFLKDKVCVMATHNEIFVKEARQIIVLNADRMTQGTTNDKQNGSFSRNDHLEPVAKSNPRQVKFVPETIHNNASLSIGPRLCNNTMDLQDSEMRLTLLDNSENVGAICSGSLGNQEPLTINTTSEDVGFESPQICNEMVDPIEATKLLDDKRDNYQIYKEFNEKGRVANKVYYFYSTSGGLWLFIFVLLLIVAAEVMIVWSYAFVSVWVGAEQKLSSIKLAQKTNSTEYLELEKSSHSMFIQYSTIVAAAGSLILLNTFGFLFYRFRASVNIHNKIVSKIFKATTQFFDKNLSGNVLNKLSRDISIIDEELPTSIHHFLQIFLFTVITLGVVSSVRLYLFIPSGLLLVILYIARSQYLPTGCSIRRLEGSTRSAVIGYLNATVDGLATIRGTKMQAVVTHEFEKHQDLYNSVLHMDISTQWAFALLLDVLCTSYIGLVTLAMIFLRNGVLSSEAGLAITQSLSISGFSLVYGIHAWAEIENSMTSAERAMSYTKIETESKEGQKPLNWPNTGIIKYSDINFRYPTTNSLVLKHLNFTIGFKEKLGVVGRTGAGKSSLISVLFRLYEFGGCITIDGIKTSNINLQYLRSKISIIPQEPYLFTASLRQNLDPYQEFSDKQLWDALEEVEMKMHIDNLNLQISEGGGNFSVGQKQLICLARAILRKNPILVLDEATANLDSNTDFTVQKTITNNFSDCTVITIAHRIQNIINCDNILVMDQGEIVEYGTPQDLLNIKSGYFFNMVKAGGLVCEQ